MSRGVETGERVHQHRKERDDDNDRGFGRPVEPEPHDHDRRDADDRQSGDEISDRQQSTSEKGVAVSGYGDEETGAAADDVAGEHAENEGLEKILPEHPKRAGEPHRDGAWRRKQYRGHAEAAHRDFPEVEHEGAEQQRYG